jgi:membrane protein implicated in regulation of membrane protease activity
MNNGSIGLCLLLIAAGAILAWAVDATVVGLDIVVVGAILMVVGAVGLVLSLLFWASFAPFSRRDDRERHGPI